MRLFAYIYGVSWTRFFYIFFSVFFSVFVSACQCEAFDSTLMTGSMPPGYQCLRSTVFVSLVPLITAQF
jgi:Na+/proline symporter